MRNFGLALLIAGCVGFYYSSQRMESLAPLPSDVAVEDAMRTDRGKWEAARYASVGGVVIGLLFIFFPQGR
jgi:hypothetical protein